MSYVKHWFAVYTKPRWEKKVDKILREYGLNSYCPLNKVKRKWSDRIKIVEEPLFKSYVFVQLLPSEMPQVRLVEGVVNFVYWNGKPAIVRDWEIEYIKRFLKEYESVEVTNLDLKPNSRVVINQGVMVGKQATIVRILNNTVEFRIESLGFKLLAKTDKSNVLPIDI
jgi:transcription antitermination factor NusG